MPQRQYLHVFFIFISSFITFHEWRKWNWCALSGWTFRCHLFSARWLVLSLWNPLQKESSLTKTGLIYRHKHNYLQCIWLAHCVHLAKQAIIDFPLELTLFPAGHLWLGFQYQMWISFLHSFTQVQWSGWIPPYQSHHYCISGHIFHHISSITNRQGLLSDCCWQFLTLAVCRTVLFYMVSWETDL